MAPIASDLHLKNKSYKQSPHMVLIGGILLTTLKKGAKEYVATAFRSKINFDKDWTIVQKSIKKKNLKKFQ